MIQYSHNRREKTHVWLAIVITLLLAVYRLCVGLVDVLQRWAVMHTHLPVVEVLLDGLFFWLLALLWVAYRRWRDSETRQIELRRILVSIQPDVLIVVDPDRTIRVCNATVRSMFGYEPEDVVGKKTDLLYHDRRLQGRVNEIHDALEKIGFHVGRARGKKRSGQEFPLEIITGDLRGGPGAVILIRDISERQEAEEKIKKYQLHLEELVQARTAELARTNEQLETELGRRRRVEQEILEISSREKRVIGQNLHDTLGQQLTGIGFLSKALERNLRAKSVPEADTAAKISSLLNEAVSQARRISHGLSPVDMVEEGLASALERLADDTDTLFGTSCRFERSAPCLIHDNTVATHLYHIAQEAVNNALRHGRPKHVMIQLHADEKGGRLSVADDGQGFPPSVDASKGMGLHIMRYRTEAMGGVLDVESSGAGTTVVCTFVNRWPRDGAGRGNHEIRFGSRDRSQAEDGREAQASSAG